MREGNYSSLFRFIQMGWTPIGINHLFKTTEWKEYENYNAWLINKRKTLIEHNNIMSGYAKSERKIKTAISAMSLKLLTFYCFLGVGLKIHNKKMTDNQIIEMIFDKFSK